MNIDNNKLSRYELMKKEKAVVARICSDDEFAYYFFHENGVVQTFLLICTYQLNLRFPNKMSMVKKVKKSSHFC